MLYSEFKVVYETVGEVGAALCINDILDIKFDVIAYDYPELARMVHPTKMSSNGIRTMLERDPDWLLGIDTTGMHYSIKTRLLMSYGSVAHLDVRSLDAYDWDYVLKSFPSLIDAYHEIVFSVITISHWQALCCRYPKIKEYFDTDTICPTIKEQLFKTYGNTAVVEFQKILGEIAI